MGLERGGERGGGRGGGKRPRCTPEQLRAKADAAARRRRRQKLRQETDAEVLRVLQEYLHSMQNLVFGRGALSTEAELREALNQHELLLVRTSARVADMRPGGSRVVDASARAADALAAGSPDLELEIEWPTDLCDTLEEAGLSPLGEWPSLPPLPAALPPFSAAVEGALPPLPPPLLPPPPP